MIYVDRPATIKNKVAKETRLLRGAMVTRKTARLLGMLLRVWKVYIVLAKRRWIRLDGKTNDFLFNSRLGPSPHPFVQFA